MPMMIAVFLSKASISLKSAFSKPFTVTHVHVSPPSIDLPTEPALPLTHTTSSLTTLKPRKDALLPELRSLTVCACIKQALKQSVNTKNIFFIFVILKNIMTGFADGINIYKMSLRNILFSFDQF